eukprot:TRINITY_DN5819_c0_g1_i10.p1 TRINITY_DN5819_c0_g1~~TRINITY_DN5819_c0_g1_i10.p1  ORF type:complete len:259 (-),score=27.86 TRINITY_DN5819_c0_g1_i10:63-839(-)
MEEVHQKGYSWKFIPALFVLSVLFEVGVIYYTAHHLPDRSPTTFEKAQQLAHVFKGYLETNYWTLMFFQVGSFLFLQTWCIPGTFFFNLLGGALFGIWVGFPVCLACNTLGAFFCYNLSRFFAGDLIHRKLGPQLNFVKQKLAEHRKDLFFYMISSRVFPGSPNWLMNITIPHLKVPKRYFVASIAIGLTPWNFLTCEAGVIISHFKSKDEIMDTKKILTFDGTCHRYPDTCSCAKILVDRGEQEGEVFISFTSSSQY